MGGLMEIPMDDVKEIKEGMHKLDIEYAKMSMVLIGIEKTQSQMVEIMDNQSRQKEKNKEGSNYGKTYDASRQTC